ncbi:MAG: protein translocase subunit SecF, partial [Filifactor alocis]
KKKIFFSISAIVIIIGLATSTFSGLNYGIDFTGGTTMGINLGKYVETTEIREITNEIDPTMSINYLGENKDSVELKTIKDLDNAERKAVFEKFKTKYNLTDDAFYKSSQFGPTVGKEIKHKAFTSVAIATFCMLLYVSFRFQLAYGIAAIIALLHDVLVVFAVYAVLRIPLNSPFVAAMLTVVGYSINDTIVIFDRVREELGGRRSNLEEVVNKSISQTLKRSINTSLTTLLAILSLYIMGVESIREFTLPLLAGITVGTYSSVCIAGSLWVILTKKLRKA